MLFRSGEVAPGLPLRFGVELDGGTGDEDDDEAPDDDDVDVFTPESVLFAPDSSLTLGPPPPFGDIEAVVVAGFAI